MAAGSMAESLFLASAPRSPDAHLLDGGHGGQLLIPEGSLLFDIDQELKETLQQALASPDQTAVKRLLGELGFDAVGTVCEEKLVEPKVRALSLAVAQKCNLGCGYCYAQGGEFGGPAKSLGLETALASIDLLLEETEPGRRANLAYLGGEPLIARAVVHSSAKYAAAKAAERNIRLGFSITTNGTLITATDIELFEQLGFAVTISLDGVGDIHDRTRPFKGRRGSYDHILARIQPLLLRQARCQVSARVTVTPGNLHLRDTLDSFIGLGFHNVGFSPMLSSPDSRHEMQSGDLAAMLDGMVECGEEFERRTVAGERYPFANLLNALREIHKGTHRPYPCGAGAGYFGVSADGELSACHRFVGEEIGALGNVTRGVDRARQAQWLSDRHVHRQSPCKSCWARYLCAGGCHHETIHRGRPACDFIRGWLHYCLGAYGRLSKIQPGMFC